MVIMCKNMNDLHVVITKLLENADKWCLITNKTPLIRIFKKLPMLNFTDVNSNKLLLLTSVKFKY